MYLFTGSDRIIPPPIFILFSNMGSCEIVNFLRAYFYLNMNVSNLYSMTPKKANLKGSRDQNE